MAVNKKDRDLLFDLYGGKCALCGDNLEKGWHATPILAPKMTINEQGSLQKINDELENRLPACKACSLSRIQNSGNELMTLERFKSKVAFSFEEMLKETSDYKQALRFGLIKETGNPIVFYCEKNDKN